MQKMFRIYFIIALAAALCLGLFGTATQVMAADRFDTYMSAMEQNTNRFGEDYKDLDLNTPDPALCSEACMNDGRCRAWSYVKPGVQGDYAKCWLKHRVPPPTPDENCVSGVKRKGPVSGSAGMKGSDRPRKYVMEQNINRAGEDYKDMDLDSPDPTICAEACMSEGRCRAWTYVKPGVQGDKAKCWLKSRAPSPSPDENCVSGVKRR